MMDHSGTIRVSSFASINSGLCIALALPRRGRSDGNTGCEKTQSGQYLSRFYNSRPPAPPTCGDETGILRFVFVLFNLHSCFLLGHDSGYLFILSFFPNPKLRVPLESPFDSRTRDTEPHRS